MQWICKYQTGWNVKKVQHNYKHNHDAAKRLMRQCGFSALPRGTTTAWDGVGFEPATQWSDENLLCLGFMCTTVHTRLGAAWWWKPTDWWCDVQTLMDFTCLHRHLECEEEIAILPLKSTLDLDQMTVINRQKQNLLVNAVHVQWRVKFKMCFFQSHSQCYGCCICHWSWEATTITVVHCAHLTQQEWHPANLI